MTPNSDADPTWPLLTGAETATIAWPEPIDLFGDLIGSPKLRREHLPDALAPFVFDTAERMGVDPSSVALAALVSCSSIASDNWRVQPKAFDYTWTESPRIRGAIVGAPSILKSPMISACTKPIDRLEILARERHSDDERQYKRDVKAWKAAGEMPDDEPRQPKLDRYIVEGTTIEAMTEVLRDDAAAKQRAPAGKVLVRQDEMSEFVANLDRYRAGGSGGGDRGAYLRMYNGGRHTVDRVGRGQFVIPNWSAAFLGGIQPGPIQKIARDTADDGFLQRLLYCVPDHQNEGVDRLPDGAALARYDALFPALAVLSPPSRQDGEGHQTVLLHADARKYQTQTIMLSRSTGALPDSSTRLQSALGKWPGMFARIALLFHLIECADARARGVQPPMLTLLQPETARRTAIYMREIILPHLLRAEHIMFATSQSEHARWIADFILSKKASRIQTRDLVVSYRSFPEDPKARLNIMESLIVAGWLEPKLSDNPAKLICSWEVNPLVHERFASFAETERLRREKIKAEMAESFAIRRSEKANSNVDNVACAA
jgi:Protein of unknown function (DUF3987)